MFGPNGSIDIQKRVRRWVESRLGPDAMDPRERAMRVLEEVIELGQALGITEDEAWLLVATVYRKPVGDVAQELGGAAMTLLGCADGCGEVLSECANRELERIESLPVEKFRRRQALNAEKGIGRPPTAPASAETPSPAPRPEREGQPTDHGDSPSDPLSGETT